MKKQRVLHLELACCSECPFFMEAERGGDGVGCEDKVPWCRKLGRELNYGAMRHWLGDPEDEVSTPFDGECPLQKEAT